LIKWLKGIGLKIWNKIRSVFSRKQMEIEQILKSWFDDTYDHLEKRFSQSNQMSELEGAINPSISVVENYLWGILKLLDKNQAHQHILPAMALLRCLYQLTSRITWIMMGANDGERESRIRRLEKDSLQWELKYVKKVLDAFKSDKRPSTRDYMKDYEMARDSMEKRIESLESTITRKLPTPTQILEEVFAGEYGAPNEGPGASELIPVRAWGTLHKTVHPDDLVLNLTVLDSEDSLIYDGDVKEDIERLKYECCVCVQRFLKEVYKFYGLENFDKIENDFVELTNAIVSR